MAWYRRLVRPAAMCACTLAAMVWLAASADAQSGGEPHRVALVIGNSTYREAALPEAAAEARGIAAALRDGGFDVVAAENASRADMAQAVAAFAGKLRPGANAIVFYSGHGVQSRDHNYLVGTQAQIRSAQDVANAALDLDLVLDPLIVARPANALVILDASRENPWQDAVAKGAKGLAAIEPLQNIVVISAAAPGRALAQAGQGNAFTAEWLKALRTPGLDAAAALSRVRDAVARTTRRAQQVWASGTPGAGLVLAGANRSATAIPGAPPVPAGTASRAGTPPAADTDQISAFELTFWETIRNSENPAEYRAYLDAYPNGRFVPLARAREQQFRQREQGGATAPNTAPAPVQLPVPPAPPRSPASSIAQAPAIAPSPAPAAAQAQRPEPARTLRDCSLCPEMVLIPAGSFEMGSTEMHEFEKPVHQVTIRSPFYLGVREVSFDEWDACVDQGGCSHRPSDRNLGRGRRPATDLHWDDANAYAAWLSTRTGRKYRLPTEAEWEYAARAGSSTSYPWGREPGKEAANCLGCNDQPRRQTIETGQFPPNAFGLYDMAGNAAEWVADCWSENYRSTPRDGSAYVAPACRERVLRGGSFNNDPRYLRSAARFKYEHDVRYYANGFRVLREP